MDLYYNPQQKLAFLATRSESQQENIKNLFRKSWKMEQELERDLCTFQMDELQRLFVCNDWDAKYATLKERVGLVRIYLVWCLEQGTEGIHVDLENVRTKNLRTERTRVSAELSVYYKSYDDFMEKVNRVFNASGISPEAGTVCKFFCALCFLGFKVNEIARMHFSDIDFENGIFRLPAELCESERPYQVVSKPAAELAKECCREYEAHFNMQIDFKLITDVTRSKYVDKPVENPAWTTKKYWRKGIEELTKGGKDIEDIPDCFNHHAIATSGKYSRIHDEIGDDIKKYTDEIAAKYVRSKSFKRTKQYETLAGYKRWYSYFYEDISDEL